jgi:hypothetical protein
MGPTQHTRSIDVGGLSEEAIKAVESFVARPRSQPAGLGGTTRFPSYEEWSKALKEWVESHSKRETLADDSREGIYAE